MIRSTTIAVGVALAVLVVLLPIHRRLTPTRCVAPAAGAAARRRWSPPGKRLPAAGERDVAAWCEQAAAAVRAGRSLTAAITEVAPSAATDTFAPVAHAVARGRSLGEALERLPADPTTAVGLVVPVLAACIELGGPAAGPLERTAAVLHARAAERAERHASAAQARMSSVVLTVLPVAMLTLLVVTDGSVRGVLSGPAGWTCLVTGGALNLAGGWWMRHIIDGAAR